MKLFQRLLVAPAALGLMAPVAANADTAFSSTTSLSGDAYFTVGSVDGSEDNEELYMQYAYGIDLKSSFAEGHTVYAGIETGNASGPLAAMDSEVTPEEDEEGILKLHSLFYEFSVGDLGITVGPLLAQDDVVAAKTSDYSDTFRLGSMPFSLAGDETGPGVAVSYSNESGIAASVSFISLGGDDSTQGIGSDDADDVTTFTLGYNGEGFGGGLVIASNDGETEGLGYDTFGGGIYYSPESMGATFSVAYDTTDPENGAEQTDLFVGIDYKVGPGTLSAAYNTTDVDGGDDADSTGFEISYSYEVTDKVTITPGFFTTEVDGDDDSGVVVETAFSF